jgi:hypothetical protein
MYVLFAPVAAPGPIARAAARTGARRWAVDTNGDAQARAYRAVWL